jgi:NAD(P)-dependent dehydrogenase (short-subunit alcohol dehydrogenase family)
MMTDTPSGRVVVITGGARGIGRGTAMYLLQHGWRIAVFDQDAQAGADLIAHEDPVRIRFFKVDVSQEDQVQQAVAETRQAFGRIDGLVNNAGIAHPYNAPIEQLSLADWQAVLNTNLTGAFLCTKHALPELKAQRGAIINMASTRALQSEPHSEAYAASKGGLLALTHALAISYGPAVRVNAICPGWIDTTPWRGPGRQSGSDLRAEDHAQHPVGRVGQVEDVAALVEFLLSERAGFITGQHFIIDGGMTRKMIYVE